MTGKRGDDRSRNSGFRAHLYSHGCADGRRASVAGGRIGGGSGPAMGVVVDSDWSDCCFEGTSLSIPGWSQLRTLQPVALADLGCLLLPLGQMIATCGVFVRGGDCRAALNLAFEWGGLWIAWWILRSAMLNRTLRQDLGALLVAMLTGLAVFGIWQHHVIYPEQGQWYLSLRSELDDLLEQGGPGGSLRANQIRQELQSNQIPLEGSERELWENRVLSSTEPTGHLRWPTHSAGCLSQPYCC